MLPEHRRLCHLLQRGVTDVFRQCFFEVIATVGLYFLWKQHKAADSPQSCSDMITMILITFQMVTGNPPTFAQHPCSPGGNSIGSTQRCQSMTIDYIAVYLLMKHGTKFPVNCIDLSDPFFVAGVDWVGTIRRKTSYWIGGTKTCQSTWYRSLRRIYGLDSA